jgi:hypothetical protein
MDWRFSFWKTHVYWEYVFLEYPINFMHEKGLLTVGGF